MAKIIDNYILVESIGFGEFSETQKGRNMVSKETVAVKTIKLDKFLKDNDLRDMIINEIQILKKLEDPHVIKMIKMLKSANNIYLVYEFLNGGSLKGFLKERGNYSESEAFSLFKNIMKACRIFANENVIHNNLAPNNIFFHDNMVKIKNFKAAYFISNKKNFQPGNLLYAAPEIFYGGKSNFKSDIFSLGLIFYEMIFGELPCNSVSLLKQFYENNFINLEKISNLKIKNLLKKVLEIDFEERCSWEELFEFVDKDSNEDEKEFEFDIQKVSFNEKYSFDECEKNPEKELSFLNSSYEEYYKEINRVILEERQKIISIMKIVNDLSKFEILNAEEIVKILLNTSKSKYESILDLIDNKDNLEKKINEEKFSFQNKGNFYINWKQTEDYSKLLNLIKNENSELINICFRFKKDFPYNGNNKRIEDENLFNLENNLIHEHFLQILEDFYKIFIVKEDINLGNSLFFLMELLKKEKFNDSAEINIENENSFERLKNNIQTKLKSFY